MADVETGLREETEDKRPQAPSLSLDLSEEKEQEILSYLTQELTDSMNARAERVKKWIKWRRQREAVPEVITTEHALSNASKIEVPLTQTYAQGAYAKVKGYYDTGKPWFWQAKSASDLPEDHLDAKLITKYFGLLANSQMDLNLDKVKRVVSDEATFMGFLMVKVVWDTLEWKFKTDDEGAGEAKTNVMTFHDGPSIIPISQEDTYYPPYWDEVQRMPWVAHGLHMPLHEFENKVASGFYDEPLDDDGEPIDVKAWLRKDFTESEQASEKLRGFTPTGANTIDLVEFHFFWDIDDDGTWEDLIFTIHVESKTIVRKLFNGIAAREFEPFGYIPRSFQLESRGIGQICEGPQDEVSATHRLRNDGMKLATIKMLAMRRTVLRENKNTIYQGKVWITDNPKEDMEPISLGEVPPSSLQSENMVWSITAQATGLSSPDRGFADPTLGTRDTFKGQALRMEQSQGIMSTIIESTSESWARVGMLVFFQLVRNAKRVVYNERRIGRLTDDEITRLERILSMPIGDVPRRMKFEIYTTDIEHSYEARRDTILKLFEMTIQVQPQLVNLANLVLGPQGMQLRQIAPLNWQQLLEIYVGGVNSLKEIYHFADFDDTENYLQNVDMLEKMVQVLRAQSSAQIQAMEAVRNQMSGGMGGMNAGASGQAAIAGGAPGAGMAQGQGGAGGASQGGAGATAIPPENEGAGAGPQGQ